MDATFCLSYFTLTAHISYGIFFLYVNLHFDCVFVESEICREISWNKRMWLVAYSHIFFSRFIFAYFSLRFALAYSNIFNHDYSHRFNFALFVHTDTSIQRKTNVQTVDKDRKKNNNKILKLEKWMVNCTCIGENFIIM